MIVINDCDLPIVAAEKIITSTKQHNPSPIEKAFAVALTGSGDAGDTADMFDLEEIKEIAGYLNLYYESHKNGD